MSSAAAVSFVTLVKVKPQRCVKLETFSGQKVEKKSFTTKPRAQSYKKQTHKHKTTERN